MIDSDVDDSIYDNGNNNCNNASNGYNDYYSTIVIVTMIPYQ